MVTTSREKGSAGSISGVNSSPVIKRLKNWLVPPVVTAYLECSTCGALCDYRADMTACSTCTAEIVIDDDTRVQLYAMDRFDNNRPYHLYVRCPHCWRLLSPGTSLCPHCREELSEEYALFSLVTEAVKTVACDNARAIASLNKLAVILALAAAYMLGVSLINGEFGFSLVIPIVTLIPMVAILIWFYRFGSMRDDDKDFLHARHQVTQSLKLWLFMLAAELFFLFLLIFPH